MLLDLADINASYFSALTFFLFKVIVPDENASVILSLFSGKIHAEIVSWYTAFLATDDLGCPFSISFNALNLS